MIHGIITNNNYSNNLPHEKNVKYYYLAYKNETSSENYIKF